MRFLAGGRLRRGYASKDLGAGLVQRWEQGKLAMRFDYVDEQLYSTIDPEVTGMVPVPLGGMAAIRAACRARSGRRVARGRR